MEDVGCPTDELRQMLQEERRRTDGLLAQLSHLAWGQARIEQRLTAIELTLGRQQAWTTSQWLKILTGIGLPLAVLLLTRDVELARRLMAP